MITAIAIDDEPMALEVIKSHASKVPFLSLKDTFTNAIKALEYLKDNPVNLIFLDIKMPDISGMELASLLPNDSLIVFTTAYSEHAVLSFELDAIDYLLKPFNLSRFLKACQKAQELISLKNGTQSNGSIFIKTGYEQVKIHFDDLLFCEANGNYVNFHLENQKILSRLTLAETEKMLPAHFIKTHRSFLVNLNKIIKLERHQVSFKTKVAPISGSYYDLLNDKLNQSHSF
ncbi:LytR/AlgR family response regulator transcription factor [Belliella kenyensis]|uniref:LytR/AlgR family response regulator transcription factor n=1 Tax=Belliella kenyensis TaxID=1472724 RepID=A0ABV8ENY8_9BACT|nr:LytTR family DNA-binding domain-containing protein [Belliella kenyensis]MCH7400469.1 LytTR family DNA-binding domain-containing protein [Belliella kenyensis]MDN3604515.1 LytTR family DNA-binding domain-containing protein [Belliella kenyensis]